MEDESLQLERKTRNKKLNYSSDCIFNLSEKNNFQQNIFKIPLIHQIEITNKNSISWQELFSQSQCSSVVSYLHKPLTKR